jgi:hypothetical protein
MISDDDRQVGFEYRVIFPAGMTPRCLDTLASLFNHEADGLIEDTEDVPSRVGAAVKAFEIAVGVAQLPQTELSQPQQNGDAQDL